MVTTVNLKTRRYVSKKSKQKSQYRSMFEQLIANTLGDQVEYEPDKLVFIQPAKKRTYNPDFKVRDKVYIECKGLFTADDRKKMVLVKEQYPDYTFYLLFQNGYQRLSKKSKTTYLDWAEKHGFVAAHAPSGIPKEWMK
jgi:Phage endonuclease I